MIKNILLIITMVLLSSTVQAAGKSKGVGFAMPEFTCDAEPWGGDEETFLKWEKCVQDHQRSDHEAFREFVLALGGKWYWVNGSNSHVYQPGKKCKESCQIALGQIADLIGRTHEARRNLVEAVAIDTGVHAKRVKKAEHAAKLAKQRAESD